VTALNLLDPPPETKGLRLANLEVLINSILYNAPAALQIMSMHDANKTKKFFVEWLDMVQEDMKFPRVHDKKLSILAMCALLTIEPSVVPPVLQDRWTDVVKGILWAFKGLPRAIAGAFNPTDSRQDVCLMMHRSSQGSSRE
jgi:importin-7